MKRNNWKKGVETAPFLRYDNYICVRYHSD